MTFDGSTSDPVQQAVRDALIGFMAATAQAQAEATREAQRAGIEAAKGDDTKYRGKKPSYSRHQFEQVLRLSNEGAGTSSIARETGLSRQTILRIKGSPLLARTALERWGL